MKLLVFLILVAIPAALSLKCYTCTNCGDKMGNETTCPSGSDKCLKVYAEAGDKESTARSCTNQLGCDLAKGVCDAAKKAKKDAECEAPCCDTDLCNSGAAPPFSVLLVSLCSLFAVVPLFK